jgi:hypothetical protein
VTRTSSAPNSAASRKGAAISGRTVREGSVTRLR